MPAPYKGQEFTFHNPDGSEIRVRGWGNQFAAVFETLDGYTIVKDPASGYFHYAQLSPDGADLIPSGRRVGTAAAEALDVPRHLRAAPAAARAQARAAREATGVRPRWEVRRQERRQQRLRSARSGDEQGEPGPQMAATVGNYVGLCLLVQFPDVPGTIPQQEVANYCNQVGYNGYGNNGSVRDYFHAVSDGRLTYTNVVTAYYTATRNRSYYTDPTIAYGTRARELIVEALDDLRGQGFDFDQLTVDGGGYVRALNVFHAGPTVNNWSEGLWPHSWALASPYVATSTRSFFDYQITSIGSQLTLGTFCHENGHMICDFPDLYDYGYESNGVGHYCLMCAGGSDVNPTQVCAYLKNTAGWTSQMTTLGPGMSVNVVSGKNDFLIHRKNPTEYFIIENRQQSGRDSSLPDAGLAIWHVDENGQNNFEQMTPAQHYECSLEQSDNRFDLERRVNNGDGDDLYGAPSARAFGPSTTPNSRWWDGSTSGLEIVDVSAPGPTMTVRTMSSWAVAGNPVLLQSRFGTRGNFELAVPARSGGGMLFAWRNNDNPSFPWAAPVSFGGASGTVAALTMIQSNFGSPGNLEVVARVGNQLHFYWRDSGPAFKWNGPIPLFGGVQGNPVMIQSRFGTKGNFELAVPAVGGGILFSWRNNDNPSRPWSTPIRFGTGSVDAITMIQSNFGRPGNLELIARVGNDLQFYWRDSGPTFRWNGPKPLFNGAVGNPVLVQSRFGTKGNFELAVPARSGGGMLFAWRNNDNPSLPWSTPIRFGKGTVEAVTMIQSNFGSPGNLELVSRVGSELQFYWRDSGPGFRWNGPSQLAAAPAQLAAEPVLVG